MVGEPERKRMEAFKMWCYRRVLKVKWVNSITNEEVFNRKNTVEESDEEKSLNDRTY